MLSVTVSTASVLAKCKLGGGTEDTSACGLHGELVGNPIQDGHLSLLGGLDNAMPDDVPESRLFGGQSNYWFIFFESHSVGESTGVSPPSADDSLAEEPWLPAARPVVRWQLRAVL